MNAVLSISKFVPQAQAFGILVGTESVLSYEHLGVPLKLIKNYGMTKEKAESVWMDTKRFLYLCGWKNDNTFSMTPTADIDKGWHEFILFTREYHQFCMKNFGEFIHYEPDIKTLIDGASSNVCSEAGCSFGNCREVSKSLALRKVKTLSDCANCQSGPGEGECGSKCQEGCKSPAEGPSLQSSEKSEIQKTYDFAKKIFGVLSDNWNFQGVSDCSGTTNCQHNCRNCNVPSE